MFALWIMSVSPICLQVQANATQCFQYLHKHCFIKTDPLFELLHFDSFLSALLFSSFSVLLISSNSLAISLVFLLILICASHGANMTYKITKARTQMQIRSTMFILLSFRIFSGIFLSFPVLPRTNNCSPSAPLFCSGCHNAWQNKYIPCRL